MTDCERHAIVDTFRAVLRALERQQEALEKFRSNPKSGALPEVIRNAGAEVQMAKTVLLRLDNTVFN